MATRFQPMFARHGGPAIIDTDRDACYYREYSDIDLAATARWLNERDAGYPGAPALYKSSPTSAVVYHR